MQHPAFAKIRFGALIAVLGTVAATTVPASAQTANPGTDAAVYARQQYEVDLAICNSAGSPAPQRALCVRDAGQRFDLLRGTPAPAEAAETADGRATVMAPSTGSSSLRGSTTTTTSDGRATVVVPEANPTN